MSNFKDQAELLLEYQNCIKLWRCVLQVAHDDTLRTVEGPKGSKGRRMLSVVWWESDECRQICEYADIDHSRILRKIREDVEKQEKEMEQARIKAMLEARALAAQADRCRKSWVQR